MLGRVRCAAIPAIRSRVALSIRAAACATEASLHGQRSEVLCAQSLWAQARYNRRVLYGTRMCSRLVWCAV